MNNFLPHDRTLSIDQSDSENVNLRGKPLRGASWRGGSKGAGGSKRKLGISVFFSEAPKSSKLDNH